MAESAIEVAAIEAAKRLGYDTLKDLQLQAVVGLVSSRDVFGIMTTGYGKSLCYGICGRSTKKTLLLALYTCNHIQSINRTFSLIKFLPFVRTCIWASCVAC